MANKYKTKAISINSTASSVNAGGGNLLQRPPSQYFKNKSIVTDNVLEISPVIKNDSCLIQLNMKSAKRKFNLKTLNIHGFEFKITNIKKKGIVKNEKDFFNESIKLYNDYLNNNLKGISGLEEFLQKNEFSIIINKNFGDFISFLKEEKDGLKIIAFRLPGYFSFLNEQFKETDPVLEKITSDFKEVKRYNDETKNMTLCEIKSIEKIEGNEKIVCVKDLILANKNGKNLSELDLRNLSFTIDNLCAHHYDNKLNNFFETNIPFEIDYYKENKSIDDSFSNYSCIFLNSRELECTCQTSMGNSNILGFDGCVSGEVESGIYNYNYSPITDSGRIHISLSSGKEIEGEIDYTKSADTKTICDNAKGDINGDGVIDILDVSTMVSEFMTDNRILSGCNYKAADLNGDGKVDHFDLISLCQLILKQSTYQNEKSVLDKVILLCQSNGMSAMVKIDSILNDFLKSKDFKDNKYTKHLSEGLGDKIKICDSNVSVNNSNCIFTDNNGIKMSDIYCTINNIRMINNPSTACN